MGCARLLLLLPLLLGSAVGAQLGAENGPSSTPLPLRRAKRCSCSSLMDEECVYFCHLDIIWINTPQKTVPYGLGGPSRVRRSLKRAVSRKLAESNRCQCANQKDKKCLNFCQTGKELWAQSTIEKSWDHLNKGAGCRGLKCLHRELLSRKMRRLEAIGNNIKTSFRTAKLKAMLHEVKQLKHNRAHRRQNSWESQKTS